MKAKWNSEKELASVVVEDFRKNGFTIYPEILDIDIVASIPDTRSPNNLRIVGIECKKTINLTVLRQAYQKRQLVDEIWIAVGKSREITMGEHVARQNGFGVMVLKKHEYKYLSESHVYYNILPTVQPIFSPRKQFGIDQLLEPSAENYAEAGQAGGKQWTPFKSTVLKLTNYVKENPGCTVSEAMKSIDHHYSSHKCAMAGVRRNIKFGIITEVKIVDKKLYIV